jgi:magnesium-transporting ATPase (P-type)
MKKTRLQPSSLFTVQVKVARDGAPFTEVAWEAVQVGDIVRVDREGRFPCDLVLLSAGEHLVCDSSCIRHTMLVMRHTMLVSSPFY